MTENIRQPWILEGYKIFSQEGSKGLKIEVISRKVNKSKSSFYHLFADIDCFMEELLTFHLERAKIIAERERACNSIDPALISSHSNLNDVLNSVKCLISLKSILNFEPT
jgi:AcrR family transcriptional regulator